MRPKTGLTEGRLELRLTLDVGVAGANMNHHDEGENSVDNTLYSASATWHPMV